MIYINIDVYTLSKISNSVRLLLSGTSIFLDVFHPQHFSPCAIDSHPNSAGINVICWSAFSLEVAATEWRRARFGPAHTCPWVFSAWCWWTSTRGVKGLSYKSGTITLEVKTCMMPLTGRRRRRRTSGGEERKNKRGTTEVCGSYRGCIAWPACLNVFPAEMLFPNDLCSVTHSLIKHTCIASKNIPGKQCYRLLYLHCNTDIG